MYENFYYLAGGLSFVIHIAVKVGLIRPVRRLRKVA